MDLYKQVAKELGLAVGLVWATLANALIPVQVQPAQRV